MLNRRYFYSTLVIAVVPACWWELAMNAAARQEAAAQVPKAEAGFQHRVQDLGTHASAPEAATLAPQDVAPIPGSSRTRSRGRALFVLGWACGTLAMALTTLALPQQIVGRLVSGNSGAGLGAVGAFKTALKTPAEMEAWRQQNLKRMREDMAEFARQQTAVKGGSWRESEKVLLGHTEELPHDSSEYVKLLVWLHLDPPLDVEVRRQVASLLLERIHRGAITLWEELSYPGSANADVIRDAAFAALNDTSFTWSDADKARLEGIVASNEVARNPTSAGL